LFDDQVEVDVEVVVEGRVPGRGMGVVRSVPSVVALPTPESPPLVHDLDFDRDLSS
jgi:hypothetical protein